ncbi:MAG: hypothetical protein DRI57_20850, partial [Deltaproteobacteria bacterium]
LLLATYLTLTPLMGSWTNEGNQWFDKYINCSKKQNISFDDIVLVDIPYPDIITFRRNVGVFLEKLAGMKPKAVGLDIIFRKFDCSDQNEMRDSTQKLLGGLKAIERAEIPLIAGYDPKKPRDYYEESIIGETSPLTNSGHTMLEIDDYGGIHARVHEDIKLDSPTSRREQKIFFPVLLAEIYAKDVKARLKESRGESLSICFPGDLSVPEVKFESVFNDDNRGEFSGKIVLIGNRRKDISRGSDQSGIQIIAYATQVLIDRFYKNKGPLLPNIPYWGFLLITAALSCFEVLILYKMIIWLKKIEHMFLLSWIISAVLFYILLWIIREYCVFTNFTTVLSGIFISSILFLYYQLKFYTIVYIDRLSYRIRKENYEFFVKHIREIEVALKGYVKEHYDKVKGDLSWEDKLIKELKDKKDKELSLPLKKLETEKKTREDKEKDSGKEGEQNILVALSFEELSKVIKTSNIVSAEWEGALNTVKEKVKSVLIDSKRLSDEDQRKCVENWNEILSQTDLST